MKKVISILMSVLFLLVAIMPGAKTVSALTTSGVQESIEMDQTTKDLLDQFPMLREYYEKGELTNIVSNEETYVRYTVDESKSRNVNDDSKTIVEKFTKPEYEMERILENRRSVTQTGTVTTSWLRLQLVVYQNTQYTFRAVSNFEWLKEPINAYTDGHGISIENLVVNGGISAQYSYRHSRDGYVYTENSPFVTNNFGVVAKHDLRLYNGVTNTAVNRGVVTVPLIFSNYGSGVNSTGNIFSSYLHKELALGGIGISYTGKPSLSLGISKSVVETSNPAIVRSY